MVGGSRGTDNLFDLTVQREYLKWLAASDSQWDTAPPGIETHLRCVDGDAARGMQVFAGASSWNADQYVDRLRPPQAVGAPTPEWVLRLAQDVPKGEEFWE